jgi:hypothetical protein
MVGLSKGWVYNGTDSSTHRPGGFSGRMPHNFPGGCKAVCTSRSVYGQAGAAASFAERTLPARSPALLRANCTGVVLTVLQSGLQTGNVIGPAESPSVLRLAVVAYEHLSPEDLRQTLEGERDQYLAWLTNEDQTNVQAPSDRGG